MNTNEAKRVFALSLSSFLVKKFNARTTILFGSFVRNEETALSDVDFLLILKAPPENERLPKDSEILSVIPKRLLPKDHPLQLSIYSDQNFEAMYHRGSLFIAHMLTQGMVLFDDGFYANLTKKEFKLSKDGLKYHLDLLSQRLEICNNLGKYNNYYISCLAEFFAISKNVAFIASALHGHLVYNRKEAFDMLEEMYPSFGGRIHRLYQLRPFFLRNVKGIRSPVPFEPSNCEKTVAELREDVRDLITLVAKDEPDN